MRTNTRWVGGTWLLGMALLVPFGLCGGHRHGGACQAADACGTGGAGPAAGCCLGCQRVGDHQPIKKTVYSCKLVPYCLPRCRHPLAHGQTCCDTCEANPRWKRVLLKREVVVGCTCGTKCEVVCLTHGGPCGEACGQASPPANLNLPSPSAYDAEPSPTPAAR